MELLRIDNLFRDLESKEDSTRYEALKEVIKLTEVEAPWVYDKWFELTEKLYADNSYQRSIGIMVLANLSKSDHENRIAALLDRFVELFDDEKFITSRQCIMNSWKLALYSEFNRKKILEGLEKTYYENIHLKKHGNLIKQDVISSLTQISATIKDEAILQKAIDLIESEIDIKLIKSLKKVVNP